MGFYETVTPYLHGLLRIMSGLVLLQNGSSKFLDFPRSDLSGMTLASTQGIAGAIALFSGFLIAIGLFTRPAAFLASGLMAFAYFLAFAPISFFPLLNDGNEAVLLCFIFLFLAGAGGGALSLDRVVFRKATLLPRNAMQ